MEFMSCLLYHFAGRNERHPENSWHVEDYVKHLHLDFVGICGKTMDDALGSTAYMVILFEQLETLTFSLQEWPNLGVQLAVMKILHHLPPSVSRVTFEVSQLCIRHCIY